jgi:hypothetical protein
MKRTWRNTLCSSEDRSIDHEGGGFREDQDRIVLEIDRVERMNLSEEGGGW